MSISSFRLRDNLADENRFEDRFRKFFLLNAKGGSGERGGASGAAPDPGTQDKTDLEAEKAIRCGACRHEITTADRIISVNGGHIHTFANPGGFVFDIGCFSDAPGCMNRGDFTSEFTWFAGYSWRFSLCSSCYAHLGWQYQGKEHGFYGLILANLIQ